MLLKFGRTNNNKAELIRFGSVPRFRQKLENISLLILEDFHINNIDLIT